jgi:hypothetical protein
MSSRISSHDHVHQIFPAPAGLVAVYSPTLLALKEHAEMTPEDPALQKFAIPVLGFAIFDRVRTRDNVEISRLRLVEPLVYASADACYRLASASSHVYEPGAVTLSQLDPQWDSPEEIPSDAAYAFSALYLNGIPFSGAPFTPAE